jgi:translation elongation factor EF-1beta
MAAGFEVKPEDIDTFATNLQAIVDKVAESKTAIDNVAFHPLVWGIVGEIIWANPVRFDSMPKVRDAISKYSGSLATATENTKLTAEQYRKTDQTISEGFKG